MSWYRRWGIIAALAVAQLGVILGYHSFLSGNGSHARAATQTPEPPPVDVKIPPISSIPEPKGLPPLSPDTNKVSGKLPDSSKDHPMVFGSGVLPPPLPVLPVSAVEKTVEPIKPPTETPLPKVADPIVGQGQNVSLQSGLPSVPIPPAPVVVPAPVSKVRDTLKDAVPSSKDNPPQEWSKPSYIAPGIVPVQHQTQVGPCPWTLRIEIVNGKTQLTASIGKEVQFRVACEKLDLQAPRGVIDASGSVTVNCDGLDGTCERLQITWAEEHIILEGKAQLKCQREGQEVELKAERLSLRLTANGIVPVRMPNNRVVPSATSEPPVQSKKMTPRTSVPVTDAPNLRVPVVDVPSGVAVGGTPSKIQD